MKRYLHSASAFTLDLFTFAYMNILHGWTPIPKEQVIRVQEYLDLCDTLAPDQFYAMPEPPFRITGAESSVSWESPVASGFAQNDRAWADLYWCERGPSAPTVLFLHALMSASDAGYKRWAKRFAECGWNAVFVHLPYHYSRIPRGYWNGQLALSADLTRSGEGLRQGVVELRQLMAALRLAGCREFGVWGTSYGGWVASILAALETEFRFLALLEPITNIEHAIFQSRACRAIRNQLVRAGIGPESVRRHFHLSSPLHMQIRTPGGRVLLAAGTFDDVALPADVLALRDRLPGAEYVELPQGHLGFMLMEEAWRWLERRRLLQE